MRIHHLNCATMNPFGGRLISGSGRPFRAAQLVCHCLLIETAGGLVLVDSGLGQADVAHPQKSPGRRFMSMTRPRLDPAETAVSQVKALGYSIDDVRHVVLTHLDAGHAGGLRDFPHASVHVHDTEHRAATNPATRLGRARYRRAQWAHGPHWARYGPTEGERWSGFEAVRQPSGLTAGIALVPLPGHTRGHTAVAVRTDSQDHAAAPGQWLVHGGDAYFFRGEVNATSHCPPGLRMFQTLVQVDGTARHRNQERLRELAAAHRGDVQLFCAHDPAEFDHCKQQGADTARDAG